MDGGEPGDVKKGGNKNIMIKSRTELAKYFNELGFTYGAEIGVSYGHYSEVLCLNILSLKLLCVDSWPPPRRDGVKRRAVRRLSRFNAVIIHKTSMDAVKDIPDESLDFVYIDADHRYRFIAEDIREWTKKVGKGGIVSGHDYLISHLCEVKRAVDEYVKEHDIDLKVIDWDMDNPNRKERFPGWYFFKK